MSSRERCVSLLALAAAALGGCTATATQSVRLMPTSGDAPYVIRDRLLHRVDKEYRNRYVCADGRLLTCQCTSRLSPTCWCSCTDGDLPIL
jgi:hypothetical protein